MNQSEKKKDRSRQNLDERKKMEAAHQEKSSEEMGDLHLKEEGWSKKARRRFRQRIKHYSDKARRRQDKDISRWQT